MNLSKTPTPSLLEDSTKESLVNVKSSPAELTVNSEEDRKARKRALKAKWAREKILRETPEERQRRLDGMKRSQKKARSKETPEEKQARLARIYETREARWKALGEEGEKQRREYFRLKASERRSSKGAELSAYKRKWEQENRDRVNATKRQRRMNPEVRAKEAEYSKKRRESNPEKVRSMTKRWRVNNPKKIKTYNESYRCRATKNAQKFRATHKDRLAKIRKERYANDIAYCLTMRLRGRMGIALRKASSKACDSPIRLLGCTVSKLITHLESLFLPGMTWKNRGEWHVDHIKPCAKFDLSDPEQQKACFCLSNLQPLWKEDNLRKHAKWTEPS